MNNYKELIVGQRSMFLTEVVDKLNSSFSDEEKCALTGQMKRSVVSIASNIAVRAGRDFKKEFRNLLGIANGPINAPNTKLEFLKPLKLVNEYKQQN